jgi:OFA family oxalate/formate antiporter-like MFS transporter
VGAVRRVLAGAALLDLAVSPLFLWDTFSAALAAELGVPPSALTVAYAVGLAAFTAGVLVGGHLADRVAPRRLAFVCAGGVTAGLATSALAPDLLVLVIGFGVVLGGTTGLGYATAVRVAGTVATGRGLAVAVVVSAYAAGAVVLAPVVEVLLPRVGRAGTFAVLAALLGVLLVGAGALLSGAAAPTGGRTRGRESARPPRGPVVVLWVVFLLGSAPALIALGQAGHLARAPELAVTAVVLLNGGNFVGRLVAGPVADRVGHAVALHTVAGALVLACVALTLARGPAVALGALLVLGLQYGAVSVLTPLALADSVPADRFGRSWGVVFTGWGAVGLLGPPAAAWVATASSYTVVASALVAVAVAFWVAVAAGSVLVRRSPTRP